MQQAAQIFSLLRHDEFHVKNQRRHFTTASLQRALQAKIAGRFWRTNQKRTGNCECTRASGMTQQKLFENL
jgi:hypothetical protein